MSEEETPKAIEPQIQILKLSSGEEVIGQVTDMVVQERQIIVLQKPAVIILQPADDKDGGKFSIGLAPYAPYANENTIHIMPQHVIGVMQPTAQMKDEYNTHYGNSDLIVPKREIIAPDEKKIII